jgi:hypothetical protein
MCLNVIGKSFARDTFHNVARKRRAPIAVRNDAAGLKDLQGLIGREVFTERNDILLILHL